MTIEYGVKTSQRPNLKKDLKPGDILEIGTKDGGTVFSVVKISDKEYLFQQLTHDTAYIYSRGVTNQKIMDFAQRYDVNYTLVKGDLKKMGLEEP